MSRSGEDGFTLIEVLIALAVLGVIMLVLGQGLRFALAGWNMQTRVVDADTDLDAVDRTLRLLMEQMDPGTARAPTQVFGSANSFAFTSELPAAASLSSREADMLLSVNAQHQLVLRWTPHLHAVPLAPPPPPHQEVLIGGIERLELGYWNSAGAGGGTWLSSWKGPRLPALVRIHLVFTRPDRRGWPEIIDGPMREPATG